MELLWTLLIGAIIGAFAGALTSRNLPMGWVGNIIAGIVGSWLGESLLGGWGPELAGMAIVPSIIGAVILVIITSFFLTGMKR